MSAPSRNAASAPGTSPTARRGLTEHPPQRHFSQRRCGKRGQGRLGKCDGTVRLARHVFGRRQRGHGGAGEGAAVEWPAFDCLASEHHDVVGASLMHDRPHRRAQSPGTLRVGVVAVAPAQRLGEVVVRAHHFAHEFRTPGGRRAAHRLASALQRLIGKSVEDGVAPTACLEPVAARIAARFRADGSASTDRTCRPPPVRRARARRPGRRSAGRRRRSLPTGGRRPHRTVRRTRAAVREVRALLGRGGRRTSGSSRPHCGGASPHETSADRARQCRGGGVRRSRQDSSCVLARRRSRVRAGVRPTVRTDPRRRRGRHRRCAHRPRGRVRGTAPPEPGRSGWARSGCHELSTTMPSSVWP